MHKKVIPSSLLLSGDPGFYLETFIICSMFVHYVLRINRCILPYPSASLPSWITFLALIALRKTRGQKRPARVANRLPLHTHSLLPPGPVGQKVNPTEVDSPPPSGSPRNDRTAAWL